MNAPEPSLSPSSQYRVIAMTVAATAATVLVFIALVVCWLYRIYRVKKKWRSRFQSSFRREAVHNSPSVEVNQENGKLDGMVVDENGLDLLYVTNAGQEISSLSNSKVRNNPMASIYNQESSWQKPGQYLEAIPEGVAMAKDSQEISTTTPSPSTMVRKLPALPKDSPPVFLPKVGFSEPKPPSVLPRKEIRSSKNDSPVEISTKLKPLRWDEVSVDVDHSVAQKEINDGVFRFTDDGIEILFRNKGQAEGKQESLLPSGSSNSTPDAPIFLLDQRKSQKTAIVLKSLVNSRKEILDAITEGRELDCDTLEKLTKIAPTAEEAASILQFEGNQTKLADAESFLYYILKAVPSGFIRLNAMQFKENYDSEILQLKESLQTLELACKELRSRGILFKLLEAVLKTGNLMNAGPPRGNAQGFNLTALLKLSNLKSPDGKSSVLHFIIEQFGRFKGMKLADLNKGLTNDDAESKNACQDLPNTNKQEMEKEYLTLGLPIVRCISTELSNCKKSATLDYDSIINTYSSLTARINEIQRGLMQCDNKDKGGFLRVMKGFLEESNEELKVIRKEQIRVMALVKRTTEYYQAGCSEEKRTKPLQLFGTVNNFLDMVEQVCIDITRKCRDPTSEMGDHRQCHQLQGLSCDSRTWLNLLHKKGDLSSDFDADF